MRFYQDIIIFRFTRVRVHNVDKEIRYVCSCNFVRFYAN